MSEKHWKKLRKEFNYILKVSDELVPIYQKTQQPKIERG